MKKIALVAAAALTASTFGLAAMAQDNSTGDFDKADANNDGWVSLQDAQTIYPTLTEVLFNQADENGDGQLDEAEFTGLKALAAGLAPNNNDDSSSMMDDDSDDSSMSSSESSSEEPA